MNRKATLVWDIESAVMVWYQLNDTQIKPSNVPINKMLTDGAADHFIDLYFILSVAFGYLFQVRF